MTRPEAERLRFIYHDVTWPHDHPASGPVANIVYAAWQRSLLAPVKVEHRRVGFDVAHHLTFGSWRQPSQLWRLGIPFVFGPVGGGEEAPRRLLATLPPRSRLSEHLRNSWNAVALRNPAVRRALQAARMVPAKTRETADWVERAGVRAPVSLEIGIEPPADPVPTIRAVDAPLQCLFVGRLVEWKGVRLAIDAVALARRNGVDVRLTIVGTGALEAELRAAVTAYGFKETIIFTGAMPQAQVFARYRSHDLLLFPSLHDSSGNVVLEALAFGLPVVCLALGGPGEMVDASCGIAIECGSIDRETTVAALADGLASLAQNERRRRSMAAGAIARAGEMTWDAAVTRVYAPLEADLAARNQVVEPYTQSQAH